MSDHMVHPNPYMLLYIGMADAYALALEYVDPTKHRGLLDELLAWKGYRAHPTHRYPGASYYSDDTEMSAANARALLLPGPLEEYAFVDAWLAEFRRGGKRKGYSRGFQAFLESVETPEQFLATVRPGSDKNGAAMRSVPFGVLPSPEEAMNMADLQARITHDTPEGRFSARTVALMSHFALYEETPFSELGTYCLDHMAAGLCYREVFTKPWRGRVKARAGSSVAITTVHAVFHLLTTELSLKGMMETLLRWGGDTDSVAAIAWGIASARMHWTAEHPPFLVKDLEGGNPHTGSVYLARLGSDLMRKYSPY